MIKTVTDSENTKELENGKNTFKKRYVNDKGSFNIIRYKFDRKLSIDYWNFKAENTNPKITWAVQTSLLRTVLNQRNVRFI